MLRVSRQVRYVFQSYTGLTECGTISSRISFHLEFGWAKQSTLNLLVGIKLSYMTSNWKLWLYNHH